MLIRLAAVTAMAMTVAGCANQSLEGSTLALNTGSIKAAAPPAEANFQGETTMAAKVLSASALEQVTGVKADPSRLDELN